jgi:hypothetical protein
LSGKNKDSNQIARIFRKHKNDILRLYKLLSLENRIVLPLAIKKDMQSFVDNLRAEPTINIKQLGLKDTQVEEILGNLITIYGLA